MLQPMAITSKTSSGHSLNENESDLTSCGNFTLLEVRTLVVLSMSFTCSTPYDAMWWDHEHCQGNDSSS